MIVISKILKYLTNPRLIFPAFKWVIQNYAPWSLKKQIIKKVDFSSSEKLIRLGSGYGGWTFELNDNLYNSTIISCGLGEDASFDIEFASKFNSKIILIDPTERAVRHFHDITLNLGKEKTKDYSGDGNQSVDSYDLSKIREEQLILVDKAVYNENNAELRFYKPPAPDHVSHSIYNWQNNRSRDTDYVIVKTVTIDEVMKEYNLESIPLIKIDIEGAEVDVIPDMLDKGISPDQICVEFCQLHRINNQSYNQFLQIYEMLVSKGYKSIRINDYPNFLFVLDSPTAG